LNAELHAELHQKLLRGGLPRKSRMRSKGGVRQKGQLVGCWSTTTCCSFYCLEVKKRSHQSMCRSSDGVDAGRAAVRLPPPPHHHRRLQQQQQQEPVRMQGTAPHYRRQHRLNARRLHRSGSGAAVAAERGVAPRVRQLRRRRRWQLQLLRRSLRRRQHYRRVSV
jgi:hypothetical protein